MPGSRSSGVCQCLPSRSGPPSAVHRRSAARESCRHHVCHIQGDGCPAAIGPARKKRVVTYPELTGTGRRAHPEFGRGGGWPTALSFESQLARVKARSEPRILAVRARQSWHHRWCSLLACATSKANALSLLERRAVVGADGGTPSTFEVVAMCSLSPDSSRLTAESGLLWCMTHLQFRCLHNTHTTPQHTNKVWLEKVWPKQAWPKQDWPK